eukprot:COSAG02_NODE_28577_length_587_cov_0.653689_1_plen_47_part_10
MDLEDAEMLVSRVAVGVCRRVVGEGQLTLSLVPCADAEKVHAAYVAF